MKKHGVKKGDRVTIYNADDPRSGLCDARLRARRRDPFGRFRRLFAEALAGRIVDCGVHLVITATRACAGQADPLKENTDTAVISLPGST